MPEFNGDLVRDSTRSSFVLFVSQIISTIVSALTLIFIARVLGAESYGEYTIALIPVSIAILFQDLGLNPAITRFTAMYRSEGRESDLKSLVKTSLIFSGSTGLLISLILYYESGFLSSAFLLRPDLKNLVEIAGLSVLGNALMNTTQAIFSGYQRMGLRSLIQVTWALARGIFGAVLVLIGLGSFGAILSNTISFLIAGILGILLIYISIKFQTDKVSLMNWGLLKNLLTYGFPLYIGILINGGLNQLFNTMMILYIPTDLIGNFSAAKNFGVLVTFLTIPIGVVLFPLYSKFKKGNSHLKPLLQKSAKYTAILTTPIVSLIIIVSRILVDIIYGSGYSYAALYLSIYLVASFFEGIGGIPLQYLIIGIGESKVSFLGDLATFLIGAPLVILLTPQYHMFGVLAAIIISPWGGMIWKLWWVRKNLGFSIDWFATIKIYGSNAVAIIISYFSLNFLDLKGWSALVFCTLIFFTTYFIALIFMKAIKKRDLIDLQNVANATGPFSQIFIRILNLLERIIIN